MIPELITPKELAGRLKVSQQAISRWVVEKKIPYTRLEGCVRFEPEEIEQWIEAGRMADGKPRQARGRTKAKARKTEKST
jgi:excisionase family DNA binding protein